MMAKPRLKSSKPVPKAAAATGQGRGLWTGQLRLALVSVPVQLVSAVKTGGRIAFHQVDQKSGKRIRYENVVPGIGKVAADNIVKGFEISKGKSVFVTDEDIENVKIEAKRTIDLAQFVDHCEIDPIYFDKPYFDKPDYVLPDGELVEEADGVLRDAMRATSRVFHRPCRQHWSRNRPPARTGCSRSNSMAIAYRSRPMAIVRKSTRDPAWTGRKKIPAIAQAASALQLDGTLMDGAAVVLDEKGRSNFPALVAALESGKGQLTGFAFDLLALEGKKFTALPLTECKAQLKKLLGRIKKSRYSIER